jgi:hypothetical protein
MDGIEWLPYEHRYWYPHMSPADTEIWNRYIDANPDAFDLVAYDVAIGGGAEFDTVVSPATGGDAARLYQRRIDVFARKRNQYFVIELKPRASTSAIGQVAGYRELLKRDHPEYTGASAIIITDTLLPDMQFLAAPVGVELRIA